MDALVMDLVLPNGDPNGIKKINLTGWNGGAFVVPRAELGVVKDRPELKESGLYFLFGEDDRGDEVVYIGESGDCYKRLCSHDSQKDYWEKAFVFLNPPNRNYLESVATKLAKIANRYEVKNSVQPKEENQNEADKIKNERYFDGLKKILLTFGYSVFESVKESTSDNQVYYLNADGVKATAELLNDGTLNVKKGSVGRKKETSSFQGWALAMRSRYVQEGILSESGDGKSYLLNQDIVIKSPSSAAVMLLGRPANGWTSWKDENGNTLDENTRGPGKYDQFFSYFESEFEKLIREDYKDISISPNSRKNYKQIKFPGYGRKHFEVRFIKNESAIELAIHNEPTTVNDFYLKNFYEKNKTKLHDELGPSVKYEEWGDHWERIFDLIPIKSDAGLDDVLAKKIAVKMKDFVVSVHPKINN
jgi:hypothetical protein